MQQLRANRIQSPELATVIDRNIRAIEDYRQDVERNKGLQARLADLVTRWSGSMLFVYLHIIWFGLWLFMNHGWFGIQPFDPFPYGLLTMIVSLEAIFLSTFVLVSQNRQAELADRRAELDLQINLLTEYELTRVLSLVDAMAKEMGVCDADRTELNELEQDVKPEVVLQELDSRAQKKNHLQQGQKHAENGR